MAARCVGCARALFACVIPVAFVIHAALVESATPNIVVFATNVLMRGSGPPQTIERVFVVPAWVVAPFTMRVDNGDRFGANRLVLAWIWINGQRVVAPSDFRRDHDTRFDDQYDRNAFAYADDQDPSEAEAIRLGLPPSDGIILKSPTLGATNKIRVRLSGQPGRYINVLITGSVGDKTPPQLSFAEPSSGETGLSVPVRLRYTDIVGAGEPAASGVNRATLRITVDGVNRTSAFVLSTSEASATLSFAEGPHLIQARVMDFAGNVATASASFIALKPPPSVCDYLLSSSSVLTSAEGGSGRIALAVQPDCRWTASTATPWVHLADVVDGYGGEVMMDEPAGYWRFGDADGITVHDVSGHDVDGSFTSSTSAVAGATGDGNTAVAFDGVAVQFASGVPLLGGPFTVESWVQSPVSGAIAVGAGWSLAIETGRIRFRAERNEVERFNLISQRALDDGTWHHVVAVYDPARQAVSIFVDGVLDGSGATLPEPLAGSALFMIGPVSATLDEVAVYRSALSPERIGVHFGRRWSRGGPGSVAYTVEPNPTFQTRTGFMTVAGLPVTIEQEARNCYVIAPAGISAASGASAGTIRLTTLDPACTWTADSPASWVQIAPAFGTGSVDLQYSLLANITPLDRSATLTIAGQTFAVTQAGVPMQRPAFHYEVAAGRQHSLALADDGRVWSWGTNASGQLGDGSVLQRSLPVLVAAPTQVVAVAAGDAHSLALKSDGTVWSWGANGYGQVGDGTVSFHASPVQVTGLSDVVAVAAGSEHSVALKADGSVWAWGRNQVGQLGDGTTTARYLAYRVTALSGRAVAIAAAGMRTFAIDATGQLWEWGAGTFAPANVSPPAPIVSVWPSSSGWYARAADGGTWSSGTAGPFPVATPEMSSQISAASTYTLTLRSDGSVWSTASGGGTPLPVAGPTDVIDIAAHVDGSSNLAVSSDGRVWAWGGNDGRQLGDGTSTSRPSPVQIADAGFVWHTGTPILTAGGTFTVEWVAIGASATPGAAIHYTLNGADPTESDPLLPIAPAGLAITQTTTLKARAWAAGKPPSGIASETYTLRVPGVTITPPGGVFSAAQMVRLTTSAAGATIRYTVDGTDPVASSPVYSSPVPVSTSAVVKATAFKAGWSPSATASATYQFNFGTLTAPAVSPVSGTYRPGEVITLTADPLATIRYTTDGTTPTVSSPSYSSPIVLSGPLTLKAAAFRTDWATSAVTTAVFTVESQVTSCAYQVTPSSVAAGVSGTSGEVTVATNDEGCAWTATTDVPWLTFDATGNASAYAQAILADHPVGYWRLADPAGAITAADASGALRSGSVSGGVTFGAARVLVDGSTAASFDGMTAEIVIPHDAGLNLPALSWEAWVNIPAVSSMPRRIFGKGSDDEAFSLWVAGGSQRVTAYYRPAGGTRQAVVMSGTVVGAGWVHVAFTYDSTSWRAYINGAADQSGATGTPLAANSRPLILGRDDTPQAWYDGQLGEFALYPYALTAEQIAHHALQRNVMARGNGRLTYVIAANPAATLRSASIRIENARIAVAQAGPGGLAIAGGLSTASQSGWTNADTTVSFACAGESVTTCSAPVVLSREGEHDVVGEVVDASGARVSTTVHVGIDKTPPYVSVSYPSVGQLVAAGTIAIRGTTIDLRSGLAGISCDGMPAEVTDVEFTCSVAAGLSQVVVRATDVASNVHEITVPITSEDAAATPPASLRITPQNVTIMAGEARRFSVLDNLGRVPANAEWTIDNATMATLTTSPEVAVTGISAGEVTLTARWRGLTATARVTVLGSAAAVGTPVWSVLPARGTVERIVQGAVTLDNQRHVYALEHDDALQQDLIRAFDVDGRELWAANAAGRVTQISGDPFGGVVVLSGTTITRFTPGGAGFPIGTDAGPGFAVDSDGAVYYVAGNVLVAGSGSMLLPPAETAGGSVDPGIPTLLEDGRVALPIHVTNTGAVPNKLQVLVISPDAGFDVHTVWESPTPLLRQDGTWERWSPDYVTPYKAVPNGHGDILVAWNALHTSLGSASNPASAYVGVVRADGQRNEYVSEVGGVWGLPPRYPWGDIVVAEDRVITTAYRLFDTENEAVASRLTLTGMIVSQDAWTSPEDRIPELPTFLAAAGGGFIVSYPNGTMGGTDASVAAMHLSKAQYQGNATWIGATGGLTTVVGPAVSEPNSVWMQAQGSGQAANAAMKPGAGLFLKGQPVFAQYFHASIRIVPTNGPRWIRTRPDMFGPLATQLFESIAGGEERRGPAPIDRYTNYFGTLGAESSLGGLESCGGQLKSDFNRSRDVSALTLDLERLVYSPLLEDRLIERLLALDRNYADDLQYACFPEAGTDQYNSNSYAAGLLRAAKVKEPRFPSRQLDWYPGWAKPVPSMRFE